MNIKQAVVFLTCRAGIEVQRERPGEEPVCFPVYLRRKGGKTMWENQWETGGGDGGEYVVIAVEELAEGDILRVGGRCWYIKWARPYHWQGEPAYYQGLAAGGKEEG